MLRLTLKGVMARKLRVLTTGLAILLGVAFMAGTLVLSDTVRQTFDDLFASVNEGTDAVIRRVAEVDSDFDQQRARVPDDLVTTVEAVDGVAAAEGQSDGLGQFIDKEGEAIGNPGQGAPTLGFNWPVNDQLNPFVLVDDGASAPPSSADELVMDKGTADEHGFEVGDSVEVLTLLPPREFTISGIARFGTADSPAGATVALFTPETAQELTGVVGEVAYISAIADDGVSQTDLATSITDAVGGDVELEVLTGAEFIDERQDEVAEGLTFFTLFLGVFAGVALVVGAFIIYNTFTIIVAQRSKEMALLRAVGASRPQVLGSILIEALVVGLVASGLGLLAGIGLATGLQSLLNALGLDIPDGPTVVTATTVAVAIGLGVLITVGSALFPAVRGSRVPPIAAMRDVALDTSGSSRRRIMIGLVVLIIGAASLLMGLFDGPPALLQLLLVGAVLAVAIDIGFRSSPETRRREAIWLAVIGLLALLALVLLISGAWQMFLLGALLVFAGVAGLGPVIAPPISRVIGWPLPRLRGVTGHLARENALRNPARTASTAAALMIGVGLVGLILIMAASIKASINQTIDEAFTGDFVIDSGGFGFGGVSPELTTELNDLPEVAAATGIRFTFVEIDGDTEGIVGIDPTTAFDIVDVGVLEGEPEDLDSTAIAIQEDVAADQGLAVGSEFPITFTDEGDVVLRVAMVYSESDLAGDYFLGNEAYEANVDDLLDFQVYVLAAEGVASDAARTAIEAVAEPYANVEVQDLTEFKDAQAAQINQLVQIIFALLALAIIIALIGIANTLALSIFERTRELGLLRAVGMTRAQLRSAIRWESVIIALLGTALGLTIGLFFGWAVVQALKDEGLSQFRIPVAQLAIVTIVAALAGVVAAILPARRAAKLNVLEAIFDE